MLVPQEAASPPWSLQGSRPSGVAELRDQLSAPSRLNCGTRQRLLELNRRLARVQALGDEYARVELSDLARAALAGHPGAEA